MSITASQALGWCLEICYFCSNNSRNLKTAQYEKPDRVKSSAFVFKKRKTWQSMKWLWSWKLIFLSCKAKTANLPWQGFKIGDWFYKKVFQDFPRLHNEHLCEPGMSTLTDTVWLLNFLNDLISLEDFDNKKVSISSIYYCWVKMEKTKT